MNNDMNSLLDSSIDDLADMPEFAVYTPGAHKVRISFEEKEINATPAVEMKMALIETLELANAGDVAQEPGTESGVLFMLNNEYGQGSLKDVLRPLAAATGVSNTRALLEAAKGMEVTVVTKIRFSKDKTKKFTDVVSLSV